MLGIVFNSYTVQQFVWCPCAQTAVDGESRMLELLDQAGREDYIAIYDSLVRIISLLRLSEVKET
jgi:hypothetical protein